MLISRKFSHDEWGVLFQQMPNEVILEPFSQVCREWNLVAYRQLRFLSDNLLNHVTDSGNRFKKTDLNLISWTIDSENSTAKLISKFIFGNALDAALLKIIKVAKEGIVTYEHISGALDSKRSALIIQALVCNNPEVSKRGIVSALALKYRSTLQVLLAPETPKFSTYSYEWVINKATFHSALDLLHSATHYLSEIEKVNRIDVKKYYFKKVHEFLESTNCPVGHILHINLKDVHANSISDYESFVSKFSHLKFLYITDRINEATFKILCKLSDLEDFTVKSNNLVGLSGIGSLTNLTNLSLKGCSKLSKIPPEIKHLTRLQSLNLSQCGTVSPKFTVPDLNVLISLKKLKIMGSGIELQPNFKDLINSLLDFNPNLRMDVDLPLDLGCLSSY